MAYVLAKYRYLQIATGLNAISVPNLHAILFLSVFFLICHNFVWVYNALAYLFRLFCYFFRLLIILILSFYSFFVLPVVTKLTLQLADLKSTPLTLDRSSFERHLKTMHKFRSDVNGHKPEYKSAKVMAEEV